MAPTNPTRTDELVNLIMTEMIGEMIWDAFQARVILRNFCQISSVEGVNTLTKTFPRGQEITFAANAENASVTPQSYTPTETSATADLQAAIVYVSELAQSATDQAAMESIVRQMAKGAAKKEDGDIAALLGANGTYSVGTPTANLQLSELDEGITLAEINTGEQAMDLSAVLHPQQVADVRVASLAGSGIGLSQTMSRADVLSLWGERSGSSMYGAYAGNYGDVPIYKTGQVPTVNAGADRGGAIFVPGMSFKVVDNFRFRLSFESDRNNNNMGDKFIGRLSYGVTAAEDASYVSVISDA